MRSLQKQQRSKSQALDRQSHAPLYHVHDPQVSLVFVCFPGIFYGNCQYMSFLCSNVCCFLYWMWLRNDATWFLSSCTWVPWLQIIMVFSDADLCREIVCKTSGLYRALWGTFTVHISHNICLLKTWLLVYLQYLITGSNHWSGFSSSFFTVFLPTYGR
jgi:hypothetical protein